jgi:hypothetical protein
MIERKRATEGGGGVTIFDGKIVRKRTRDEANGRAKGRPQCLNSHVNEGAVRVLDN